MKTIQFAEPVDEKTKLDVAVEIGSVTIRPSTQKEIHIEASYRHMDVWVERRDHTVFVRAEQEEGFRQRLSRLFSSDQPKADIVIHLPAHCEIQAKTVTGSLDVEGVQAPVTGRVITGKLHLKDIQGPIYAKTVTGKLHYAGELTAENHRFETVTGEIRLTLPHTTNARLTAHTTTGKLRCRLPLAERQAQNHFVGGKLRGVLGSGAGQIKVKVTTGNMLIQPITEKTAQPTLELG
jgi:hypothetical protein